MRGRLSLLSLVLLLCALVAPAAAQQPQAGRRGLRPGGALTLPQVATAPLPKEADATISVADTTTAATAGGALTVKGGKGSTSGAGGVAKILGGQGGATGAGGAAQVTAGAGGSTSGTGGAVAITGGAGTAGNANGGAVAIDAGAKHGSGTDGAITIGATSAESIGIGRSGKIVTFSGPIAASATAWNIADPGASGAIPVTRSGVVNLTSAGAETRTLAAPTFEGQEISISCNVDGGDNVVTVASAFNIAGNTTITFNDAGDHVRLVAVRIAGALRWRLLVNDGATLG